MVRWLPAAGWSPAAVCINTYLKFILHQVSLVHQVTTKSN